MTLLPFQYHVYLTNIKVKVIFPSKIPMEYPLVACNEIVLFLFFFTDPECQKINKQHRCYTAEPFCPPETPNQSGNDLSTLYVGIGIGSTLFIIIILSTVAALWWRKRNLKSKTGLINDSLILV